MDRDPNTMTYEELKKALAAEDHYRHADALHDHMSWRADPDGNVTVVNGQLKTSLGISMSDVAGERWTSLVHPDDRDKSTILFSQAMQTGEPMSYTNRVLDKITGEYRWTKVSARPRRDKTGKIIAWYGVTADINDSITLIERQTTLLHELNHRVKNSLTTVQSIVMQTFRSLRERDGYNIQAYQTFCDKVMERLLLLSNAHDLLTKNSWTGTDLNSLIDHTLRTIMISNRFEVNGPTIELCPNAALLLAMIFHELGTNAIKYGAWSNDGGIVIVGWSADENHVELVWRERGGPTITAPDHIGFGTKLITKTGLKELGGTTSMRFDPEGLTCYLKFAISEKVKRL